MPQFNFLKEILSNFVQYPDRNAFFISDKFFSYRDFSRRIADIQAALLKHPGNTSHCGVVLKNDLDTYASIFALWFSGRAFIPVNPGFPVSRNQNIMKQTGLSIVLCSSREGVDQSLFSSCAVLDTADVPAGNTHLPVLLESDPESDLYVLFTSGSTGKPKGVRLSIANLNAFVRDFIEFPSYDFTSDDRFLQIYDLSFDASIHCYVVPLVLGASVYTVAQDEIKYLAAYKLILNQKLTFVKMPPSTLSYLKPYFSTINLPQLKYCLLGGEAFPAMLAESWESCVPNALIQNVYGPTEATINCLIYNWNGSDGKKKEFQGTVSVGKPFGSNRALVLKDGLEPALPGETGELFIAGEQVSPGYLGNDPLNSLVFENIETDGKSLRYYMTGDMVTLDEDGDIMYLSRKDDQVQVDGYRVELGEIELMARKYLSGLNVVALGKEGEPGQMRIYLLVETEFLEDIPLIEFLTDHLPHYMVPSEIISLPEFPKLVSGKLDRKALNKFLSAD